MARSGVALLAALLACDVARGELLPVVWDASGRFTHEAQVAPGKFIEVCEKLPRNAKVSWSYRSAVPMDFNIHYHEGKDVKFSAKQNASAEAQGTLDATVEQDYCWMWTNPHKAPAALALTLKRA